MFHLAAFFTLDGLRYRNGQFFVGEIRYEKSSLFLSYTLVCPQREDLWAAAHTRGS